MHHTSKLAIVLSVCALVFAVSAFFMTTQYSHYAVISGMLLVLFMTCGFFYATLHLSKIQ